MSQEDKGLRFETGIIVIMVLFMVLFSATFAVKTLSDRVGLLEQRVDVYEARVDSLTEEFIRGDK